MDIPLFLTQYLLWHYSRAFRDILAVWGNLLWFVVHFFSFGTLLRTFFAPWHRMRGVYRQGDLEAILTNIVFTVLSRFIGALVRLTLILACLAVVAVLFLGLIAFLVSWSLLPFLSIGSVWYGLHLILL